MNAALKDYLESGQLYRVLMENVDGYAVVVLDEGGVIRSWNIGAEKVLGYKQDEAIGKSAAIFFTDEDVSSGEYAGELETARRHGMAEDERWHVHKDGSLFWGSGLLLAIKDGEEVVGFAKIFRDRTKEREYELRKDEFVVMASHEMRTPLSIIKANAELIHPQVDPKNTPEVAEGIRHINEQVDHLTRMVDDFLDLSKIMSGKLTSNKHPMDIKELVEEVVRDYQQMNINHEVCLLKSDSGTVMADKGQMIQVLQNIISNAIKYSPNGSKIELWTKKTDRQISVYVRDFGIGITPREINKIFDRFYQVGNRHRVKGTGLGLGLYVSLEILKQHAGSIHVESAGEGQGTTFHFTLPLIEG